MMQTLPIALHDLRDALRDGALHHRARSHPERHEPTAHIAAPGVTAT